MRMDKRASIRFLSLVFSTALIGALSMPATTAFASVEDGNVEISNDAQFTPQNGVRSGSGTKRDPYVIEGWDLSRLEIHDTDRFVVIRNNILNNLTLNWVGDRVRVVNNRIGDLRVNQNVERKGEATSGVISFNRFGHVGQLRHWDGVFSHNVVGDRAADESFQFGTGGHRIANLDGFNGAKYVDNAFYGGYVELRLHGHHHSSGFDESSHYHGADPHGEKMGLTHMERYHKALFARNTIQTPGSYGLIYTDSNHAGNDRTAASETNEALNDPHAHHTKVSIVNNELIGGGIVVDIFNADDGQKHLRTNTGHLDIRGNSVKLKEYRETVDGWNEPPVGIEVHEARDLHLHIVDNSIAGVTAESTRAMTDQIGGHVASGIELWDIEKAWIHIVDNFVSNRLAGVYARDFNRVEWWIDNLKTEGVETEVDYDNSSASPQRKQRH